MMFTDERMPRGQDDQERLSALRHEKTLESYEYLLSDPRGRRFLMQLGQRYHLYETTFAAQGDMSYCEGQRSVVLALYGDIRMISQKAEESLLLAEMEYRREGRALEQKAKGECE